MTRPAERVVLWAPRVLCIVYAVFIGRFALDVLDGERGFWETIPALLMHLIPAAFVVVVLIVSWRKEWMGGVVFVFAGLYYAFRTLNHLDWILAISGPMVVIGALFLLSWSQRRRRRAGS